MASEINTFFGNEKRDTIDEVPTQGRFYKCWPGIGVKYVAPAGLINTVDKFPVLAGGLSTLYDPVRAILCPPYPSLSVFLIGSNNPTIGGPGTAGPCGIRLVVRGGFEAAQEELFVGDFGQDTPNASGLLVNCSGLANTEYQIWARAIANKKTGVAAHQMYITLGFILTFCCKDEPVTIGKKFYTP